MSSTVEDDVTEAMDSITECPVCQKIITKATWLPCVHTFCSQCLGNTKASTTVACPVCGKFYSSSELRSDPFVQDLVDECLSAGKPGRNFCDLCADDELESESQLGNAAEDEPGTLASMHCLDCRSNLCADCCRGHRRHCKGHEIVDLDDVQLKRRSVFRSVQRCRHHPEEQPKIFCSDCLSVVCVMCYAEKHHSHNCKDVGNAAGEMQRLLREDMTWLDTCASGLSTTITGLEKDWQCFEENAKEMREKVREKGQVMRRMVDDHVTRLTKELDSLSQVKFSEFMSSKKAFKDLLRDTHHLKKYSLMLTENGSPCHIVDCFARLKARAAELKVVRPEANGTTSQKLDIVFAKPDPTELLSGETEKVFGRVSMFEESDLTEGVENVKESSSEMVGAIDTEGRGVMGVTMLNNKIYIACAWTNALLVHSAEPPFARNPPILVKDMRCPNDMASCTDSSCVYVVDSEHSCVWRINSSGQSDRWPGKASQPWTISVTCGRVVLPSEGKPPQLNVYGPGGGILYRVRLPSAVTAVQHAVELSNGHFIVSHGRNSGHANRICEISKSGNMVRAFDGVSEPGGGTPSVAIIKWPKHLAFDGYSTVFVAEFSNHYVLVLNRSLQLERILLSWDRDRIDAPSRLCYVPGTRCLLLAEATSVKVYDVHGLPSRNSSNSTYQMQRLFEASKR